jgi:hypothetical protein
VYLFHELPEEARLAAAKEWARLLKPGGTVVLVDSCQLGDRPAWDPTLGAFGEFNEPHYVSRVASFYDCNPTGCCRLQSAVHGLLLLSAFLTWRCIGRLVCCLPLVVVQQRNGVPPRAFRTLANSSTKPEPKPNQTRP